MTKLKRNNSGFTAIEALLILVIAGILAGTGFYVYKAQNNANETLDVADTTAASQTPTIENTNTPVSAVKATNNVPTYTNYSKLPQTFKDAYADSTKIDAINNCVNSAGIPRDEFGNAMDLSAFYIPNKFVGITECDSKVIFAYTDNAWNMIDKTKSLFTCTNLTNYHVPSSLIITDGKSSCLDANSQVQVYTD